MTDLSGRLICLALMALPGAHALALPAKAEPEPAATAIRCELRTARQPDAFQAFYFYLNDARRTVLETDGNPLGNVVQYSRQRVVVTKPHADGGVRTYTFDRMIGSLSIVSPPATGTREPWALSGDCQQVDATRQKF